MLITITCEGVPQTHLPHPSGNYASLCGLDGHDSHIDVQQSSEPTTSTHLDCPDCIRIWEFCRAVRGFSTTPTSKPKNKRTPT